MPFTFTKCQIDGFVEIQPKVFDDVRGYFLETLSECDSQVGTAAHCAQERVFFNEQVKYNENLLLTKAKKTGKVQGQFLCAILEKCCKKPFQFARILIIANFEKNGRFAAKIINSVKN